MGGPVERNCYVEGPVERNGYVEGPVKRNSYVEESGQSGQSGRGCYMPCTADVAEVYELKLDDNPQLTLAVEEGRSGSEWWWSLCCHHLRLLSLRGCTRCWLPRTHAKIVHVHADGALHVKYGALGEEFRVNPDFVCAVTPLSPAPSDTSRATTLKRR